MAMSLSSAGALPARAAPSTAQEETAEKTPLPGWVASIFQILPVVIYIPDAIFNYFVYSDGVVFPGGGNWAINAFSVVLWSFMSIAVVGSAYVFSVLAPHHWMRSRYIQAFLCMCGVVVATAITIWNSLAYRSLHFISFPTDAWPQAIFPVLGQHHISVTMILVAVAPPAWGIFWALVQPTSMHRRFDANKAQEDHTAKMIKLQQKNDEDILRTRLAAQKRSEQLKSVADTATVARQQMGGVVQQALAERRTRKQGQEVPVEGPGSSQVMPLHVSRGGMDEGDTNIEIPIVSPTSPVAPVTEAPAPRPAKRPKTSSGGLSSSGKHRAQAGKAAGDSRYNSNASFGGRQLTEDLGEEDAVLLPAGSQNGHNGHQGPTRYDGPGDSQWMRNFNQNAGDDGEETA